jgi:thiol-disulfide isomerase/thioredoxin
MRIGDKIPSFDGATQWLNTPSDFQIDEYLQGSPTLVYFWAVSCGICKDNLPKLRELKERYEDYGLKLVAVHMPRYETDTDIEKVLQIVKEFAISDVCAVDNLHKLRDAFRNEQAWVPFYYLFDAEGKLKTKAAGEYGIGIVASALEKMFPEARQVGA